MYALIMVNKMSNFEIKKCTDKDIEIVGAFYEETVRVMSETNTNYPLWHSDYPCTQSVKEATASGTQYFCTLNGKICGAFVINNEPGGAYEKGDWKADLNLGEYLIIHTLAVDQKMKGCGIGSRMVQYCIDHAVLGGYKAVRVDVVPTNIPAIRLYEKHGFTFAGEKDLERGIADIPTFSLYELNL